MNQRLVAGISQKNHHVIVANNGREALETLNSRTFDLIVMDVQMPEMDGIEATLRDSSK